MWNDRVFDILGFIIKTYNDLFYIFLILTQFLYLIYVYYSSISIINFSYFMYLLVLCLIANWGIFYYKLRIKVFWV